MMHQIFVARAFRLLILLAIGGEIMRAEPTRAADGGAAAPIHTVSVRLRGPVAWVEVVRSLTAAPGGRPDAREAVLDLALPARAALLSVEVKDRGGPERWQPIRADENGHARRVYADALLQRGLSAVRDAADEAATHRVRVVWGTDAPRGPPVLRYRFTALLEPAADRLRLRFAPSTELTPTPATVTVTVEGAGPGDLEIAGQRVTTGGGHARLHGQAPARTAWDLSYRPHTAISAGSGDAQAPGLDGLAAVAALPDGSRAVAAAALARWRDRSDPPGTVLFLIDRSRSVGLAGLSAERDTARQLLELLPPATRFEALFFDRATTRMFGSFRLASREAIAALDGELVPDRLANGTDLRAGLRAAGALLRHEKSSGLARALLVVISDGALPDDQTGPALTEALGAVPGVALSVAALVVRPGDDEAADPAAHAALRQLATLPGGLVRDIAAHDLARAVSDALADLQRGGDLFDVQVVGGDARRNLAARLAPGQLATTIVRWPAAPARGFTLQAIAHGRVVTAPLRAVPVDASWLRPLLPAATVTTGPGVTSLLQTAPLTVLVETIEPSSAGATDAGEPARGSVDRAVVQNTLGLAFIPRARACYQNRPAATPAARDLAGRVRLAIDLSRGEVAAARIESSTLAAPAVEACLRESAFALDVPRASRADAPVTAVVNLVFRPRPPDKVRTAEDTFPISGDIDLALEELRKFERQKPPESR